MCFYSGSQAAKQGRVLLDQISDDSDDGYSDDNGIESDIDLEEFEEIDNLDLAEEEEDDSMPAATPARKRAPAKTTARRSTRKATINLADENARDGALVDAMKRLNMMGEATAKPAFKSFSKHKTYCYFIYEYKKYNRECAKVEIQVCPQLQPDFKITVSDDGSSIEVREKISPHFFHTSRNDKTNARNMEYNSLSAAKQAFETKIAEIRHGEDDPNAIWTDPHVIPLPFPCEEELIGCFVRFHKKDDQDQTDKFGAEQWEGTIHVELRSKKAIVENVLADDGDHDLID